MVSDKTLGIGNVGPASGLVPSPSTLNKPEKTSGPGFDSLLDNAIGKNPASEPKTQSPQFDGLKFSQHALDRMASRGITFKPEDLTRLTDAIDKASKKGSKESLVLMGDNALIVSVKNKTVVTAMDKEAMKENVFTNIDSTVIL